MRRQDQKKLLTPALILSAYRRGLFPMADPHGKIGFYAYEPRGIVPLDDRFTVRRSLRSTMRRMKYEVRFDSDFSSVIHACSRQNVLPKNEIWLSEDLIDCYLELHKLGIAHSVEVWQTEAESPALVGGLYGLTLGAAFCGESMFSLVPYASQIALVHLVERLRISGFELLDAQMTSPHLKQFGLYEVSDAEYHLLLEKALPKSRTFL